MSNQKYIFSLLLVIVSVLPFDSAEAGRFCQTDVDQIPNDEYISNTVRDTDCFGDIAVITSQVPGFNSTSRVARCSNFRQPPLGFVVVPAIGSFGSIDCNGGSFGNGNRQFIQRPFNGQDICATISPFPAGFVILSVGSDSRCGSAPVTYEIRRPTTTPRASTTVCLQTPIPSGFVVTSNTVSAGNCGNTSRRLRITNPGAPTPGNPITICAINSTVPSGFTVLSTGSSTACGGGNSTGPTITIGSPGHLSVVCSPGSIPNGFLVTEIDNFSQCDGGVGSRIFEISRISGSVDICSNSTPPPFGFIVTRVVSSSICSSNSSAPLATIRLPSDTNTTRICTNFGFPLTHGITRDLGSSNDCSSGGSGPQADIISLDSGAGICDSPQLSGLRETPAGRVIREVRTDSDCPFGNRLILDFPDPDGTDICVRFTNDIPSGYVITRLSTANCGINRNAYFIRVPNTNGDTLICDNSPIPSGFTIVRSNIQGVNCGRFARGSIIQPISLNTTDGIEVCLGTPIPEDFVVTAFNENSTACGILGSQTLRRLTGDPIVICVGTPFPDNYVIRRVLNSSSCANFGAGADNALEIALPNPTGETVTCSDPPEGFRLLRRISSSQCGLVNFANIIVADNGVIPDVFVDPIRNVSPTGVPAVNFDCGNAAQGVFLSGKSRNNAACP